ncbi:hypothetical protein ABT160_19825 [Streptomyces sp. NPDC001941]|uniref:hypothetical protein n=1 Tax=Streptomyces sp. NPDC001941 TaxID=3154659 RepID=UPI00332595A3
MQPHVRTVLPTALVCALVPSLLGSSLTPGAPAAPTALSAGPGPLLSARPPVGPHGHAYALTWQIHRGDRLIRTLTSRAPADAGGRREVGVPAGVLRERTAYTFRVRVRDGAAHGTWSGPAAFRTPS